MDDFNQKRLSDEETSSDSEAITPEYTNDSGTNPTMNMPEAERQKIISGSAPDSEAEMQSRQEHTGQPPQNQAPWQQEQQPQDSGNQQQGQAPQHPGNWQPQGQNYPSPENWQQGQNYPNPGNWQQGQGQNYPNPENWQQGQNYPTPGNWQQGQGQNYPAPGNWQQGQGQMPPAPGQAPYQQTPPQGYYYGQQEPGVQGQPNPPQPKPPANNMAVTSMVLGIISLLISCCCFPIGFIIGFALGMGGLVLSVLSRKGKPFSGFAVAGLVLSILGICVSLFIFICYLITANLMQDPEYAALFNEILRQYYNGN